jgi:hypothetical protein
MDRISAPPQNALLGRLADLLRLAETGAAGGPEFLPRGLDVMNLVRQLALPSAETVEKLSYGDPLFRMAPSGTGSRIPMTTDREYLADVAGMVPIAAPAAKPSARGVQELVRQIQTEPPVGAVTPKSLLDTLNPTGSIFVDYDPIFRATAELSPRLTTYDLTAGLRPNDFVTIYRGVPSGVKSINAGDFVTTNKKLATDYAGTGKVLSKRVRAKEILDEVEYPLGEEYIYRPTAKK